MEKCCNHNCNEGRACPLAVARTKDLRVEIAVAIFTFIVLMTYVVI